MLYAVILPGLLREPRRGAADEKPSPKAADPQIDGPAEAQLSFTASLGEILGNHAAVMLLIVFAGANFVAGTLLAWLPQFVKERHGLDLGAAATVAGLFFPAGNLVGALYGGVLADAVARRIPAGRVLVQASGLLLGAPCVYLAGMADSMRVLVPALVGIGLCKGIYDANIFAAVFDVVRPAVRGTAAGLMNTSAWAAASAAPLLVGWFSQQDGLGAAIAWTAAVYLQAGLLALVAALVVHRRLRAAA
jgi:sugar phosphate permease